MEANEVAKGGAAVLKTLFLDLLWILSTAATVDGHPCVATSQIVGPDDMILAKSRFEILGISDR